MLVRRLGFLVTKQFDACSVDANACWTIKSRNLELAASLQSSYNISWVVHSDHASILRRYGDMAPQILDARTWTRKEKRKTKKRKKKRERKGREKESGRGKEMESTAKGRKMERGRKRERGKGMEKRKGKEKEKGYEKEKRKGKREEKREKVKERESER